jgi:hypothetical protein
MLSSSLSVSATELERPGDLPLLAVEARQDGRLVQAAVVDPYEVEWERSGPLSFEAEVMLPRSAEGIDVQVRVG